MPSKGHMMDRYITNFISDTLEFGLREMQGQVKGREVGTANETSMGE